MPTYRKGDSQWEETWGNPSYGFSKAGLTPDDIKDMQAEREREHEESKKES